MTVAIFSQGVVNKYLSLPQPGAEADGWPLRLPGSNVPFSATAGTAKPFLLSGVCREAKRGAALCRKGKEPVLQRGASYALFLGLGDYGQALCFLRGC